MGTLSKNETERPVIGITLGDFNGIGPEVVMKALADARLLSFFTPVIYGSARVLSFYRKPLNLDELQYQTVRQLHQFSDQSINVVNCWDEAWEITPGVPSSAGGQGALLALRQAVEDCKAGVLDALVTGPIDKHSIHGEAFPYRGHTEYLTDVFDATESLMMMVSDALRVGLVTEHVPLREVSALLSRERVELKIRLMEYSLKKDFGITKPKVAVLGLNPHAGDQGLIGSEELEVMVPVIDDLRRQGKLIFGPYSADGFFASGNHARFDGVVAMYHDQGLVAFKTLAFSTGVNFTAGLPIVRTSPDHGTAYAIAGKGQADESSLRHALYLALDIIRTRKAATEAVA